MQSTGGTSGTLGAPGATEDTCTTAWQDGASAGGSVGGAGSGSEFQAELNFTMDLQGRVQGQFSWMLVQSPRQEDQAKIGMRGVEHVEGSFDIQTGSLTLRGTRTDDPNHVIGPDVYRLVVSPNGQYIVGMSENGGNWQGRLELTRFGPS